jgi:CheY-like chemotaxis protein
METTEYKPLLLVAEDDDSNFRLIEAIIGKQCVIKWAKTGEDMVELFHKHAGEVEAMLMDIKMPKMTGLQATQIIREEDKITPIIVQTAYAFASDREAAMSAGATDVLVKPITLNVLRTCISKYLPQVKW